MTFIQLIFTNPAQEKRPENSKSEDNATPDISTVDVNLSLFFLNTAIKNAIVVLLYSMTLFITCAALSVLHGTWVVRLISDAVLLGVPAVLEFVEYIFEYVFGYGNLALVILIIILSFFHDNDECPNCHSRGKCGLTSTTSFLYLFLYIRFTVRIVHHLVSKEYNGLWF